MRAAVREELDDLDLVAALDRLRILDALVVLALDELGAARTRQRRPHRRERAMASAASSGREAAPEVERRSDVARLRWSGRRPRGPGGLTGRWAHAAALESANAARPSVFDDGDVEAAPREVGLHARELVGIVVRAEAHAVADAPLSGSVPSWTFASQPPSASRAFRFSASDCAVNEPACSQ